MIRRLIIYLVIAVTCVQLPLFAQADLANVSDAQAWRYIDTIKYRLVTEESKDFAFEAPTESFVDKTWISHDYYTGDYYEAIGHGNCNSALRLNKNGTYSEAIQITPKWDYVANQGTWQVKVNGVWMRYKNEHICLKPNALSVCVNCIKYESTPYDSLSVRKKSNANDRCETFKKEIIDKIQRTQNPKSLILIDYPNDWPRSQCSRIDDYFFILGGTTYVNKDRVKEIYIKSIE